MLRKFTVLMESVFIVHIVMFSCQNLASFVFSISVINEMFSFFGLEYVYTSAFRISGLRFFFFCKAFEKKKKKIKEVHHESRLVLVTDGQFALIFLKENNHFSLMKQ